jgi:predicted glycosyltransferase
MAYEEHARLARAAEAAGVILRRVLPELRGHVALADCVVAMPGYNTVCDILSYRRRAVLVPRASPGLEQPMRAERLQEWGIAEVVAARELGADRLAAAIERALAAGLPPPAPVALDGLERALDVFDGKAARVVAA